MFEQTGRYRNKTIRTEQLIKKVIAPYDNIRRATEQQLVIANLKAEHQKFKSIIHKFINTNKQLLRDNELAQSPEVYKRIIEAVQKVRYDVLLRISDSVIQQESEYVGSVQN